MKRKQLLIGNLMGIVLILLVIITGKISYTSFTSSLSNSISQSSSIGVIGGADGPTSIFISGNMDLNTLQLLFLIPLIIVVILLLLNIVYLIKHRQQSQPPRE